MDDLVKPAHWPDVEIADELEAQRARNARLHRLFNAVEEALEINDTSAAIAIIAQARSPSADRMANDELEALRAELARVREAERRLRMFIADQANSINIVGSHYDQAITTLDAMVHSIKQNARTALAAWNGEKG